MMFEPAKDDMPNKTKAFPYGAKAFEENIKGAITCIVFPAFFLFFRPHSRFVLNVGVK